jgi:hypothetical protein
LVIPASSGTITVNYNTSASGKKCSTNEPESYTPISGTTSRAVTNVVEIWISANAKGVDIPCGSPPATPIVWDGSVFYKNASGTTTQISLFGVTFTAGGGWGSSSSITGVGSVTFEFVTSVGGVIGPVYVGTTAPFP